MSGDDTISWCEFIRDSESGRLRLVRLSLAGPKNVPMSRVGGAVTRAGAREMASGRSAGRRQTAAARQRAKKTDKESGFESCPNSPRSDAAVETAEHCQCGAQKGKPVS